LKEIPVFTGIKINVLLRYAKFKDFAVKFGDLGVGQINVVNTTVCSDKHTLFSFGTRVVNRKGKTVSNVQNQIRRRGKRNEKY
jgi:hypothetical protein